MNKPVYLDYASTTPVDPMVVRVMTRYLGQDGVFGNPASRSHHYGWEAEKAVEEARAQVANLMNAEPREIIWTSGATESDNLAIKGAAHFHASRGKHIVTSALEHKAVLDSCRCLEQEGFETTYLEPDRDGVITPMCVKDALREDTSLVSLMHVNNEIGTITDIASIGEITREREIKFHVDAAQSAARLRLDMQNIQADYVSLSAHKMYGPKGVGALYVRNRRSTRLQAQMHGGGHERGLRSGTLATHQVAGMGEAARLARERLVVDSAHVEALTRRLLNRLNRIEQIFVNGERAHSVPGIVNVGFACVESESLMMRLKNEVALSSGSACTSASLEPSYVLHALGVDEEMAYSSLRFSLGRFTTQEEVDYATERIYASVVELRSLSPLWIGSHGELEFNTEHHEVFGGS